MTIELYAAPDATQSGLVESPVSNTTGELPEQEPTLNFGDLLGSFSSREAAIGFIGEQVEKRNQVMSDSKSAPFNEYTHIEWLTITVETGGQSTQNENYYLVTDEGY